MKVDKMLRGIGFAKHLLSRKFSSAGPIHGNSPRVGKVLVRTTNSSFVHDEVGSIQNIFKNLNFSVTRWPRNNSGALEEVWNAVCTSSRVTTEFLHALRGQLTCIPMDSLTYPYLNELRGVSCNQHSNISLNLNSYIQYVGADLSAGQALRQAGFHLRGGHLGARYESFRDATDFCVRDYLTGSVQLNPARDIRDDESTSVTRDEAMQDLTRQLGIRHLLDSFTCNLSHGQMRRARIAKALLREPKLILLDRPFDGLDPLTCQVVSQVLKEWISKRADVSCIFGSCLNDFTPDWITHVVLLSSQYTLMRQGRKEEVSQYISVQREAIARNCDIKSLEKRWKDLWEAETASPKQSKTRISLDGIEMDGATKNPVTGEKLVEMKGVHIRYGDRVVLGGGEKGIEWTIRRGDRWGVFGTNGSGKTTLLSLIRSDHPQAYSTGIRVFGRCRLPENGQLGIPIHELHERIGYFSPEYHSFFPKEFCVRRVIESAWSGTVYEKPRLTSEIDNRVDATLNWFAAELNPAYNERVAKNWQDIDKYCPVGQHSYAKRTINEIERAEACDSNVGWADEVALGDLSFSAQRIVMFLRAIVHAPDLIILDEVFGGMDDRSRDKCMLYLAQGEQMVHTFKQAKGLPSARPLVKKSLLADMGRVKFTGLTDRQALIVVSQDKRHVPGCVREWIYLPANGMREYRFGRFKGPLELGPDDWWNDIWGIGQDTAQD